MKRARFLATNRRERKPMHNAGEVGAELNVNEGPTSQAAVENNAVVAAIGTK